MQGAARQGDPLALMTVAAGCRAKSRPERGAIAAMPALLRASAVGFRCVVVLEKSPGAGAGRHGIRE